MDSRGDLTEAPVGNVPFWVECLVVGMGTLLIDRIGTLEEELFSVQRRGRTNHISLSI